MPQAQQGKLIETDHPATAKIMEKAELYVSLRDARMAAMKPEKEARDALLEIMLAHDLETFTHDGLKARIIRGKTKVRVKFVTDDETADEDEDEA